MASPLPGSGSLSSVSSTAASLGTAARVSGLARDGVDKVLPVLRKVVPIAKRLGTVVRVYAAMAAAATVVIVLAMVLSGPVGWAQWLAVLVLAGLLALPSVVLWTFARALDEVVALPARIRENPEVMMGHAAEVSDLVRESHARTRHRRWLIGLPSDLWKGGKLLLQAHHDLPEYGHAIRLISVPYLIATGLAALGALMEMFMAPVIVVLALLLA